MKKIAIAALAAVMAAGLVSCGNVKGAELSANDRDTVVWKNKYMTVVFDEYDDSDPTTPRIKLKATNRSKSTMYLFPQCMYINDYFFQPIMNESIEAGETAEAVIDIKSKDFEYSGIGEIGKISLWLMSDDPDKSGFENLYLNSQEIVINTGNSDWETSQTEPKGDLLYEEDGLKIKALTYSKKENGDIIVPVYVENNTGDEAAIAMYGLRIDGRDAVPSDGNTVSLKSGKKAVVPMSVTDVNNAVVTEHFSKTEVQFIITKPNGKNETKSDLTDFVELKGII